MQKLNIHPDVLRKALNVYKQTIIRAKTKEANLTILEIREREVADLEAAIASITAVKG